MNPAGLTDSPPTSSHPELSPVLSSQQGGLKYLPAKFSDGFSDIPSCTNIQEYYITLNTTYRIQANASRNRPAEGHLSTFFFSSSVPFVIVKKAVGTYRMTIDFRQRNFITRFHAEPTCDMEEDLERLSGAQYFSE